MPLPPILLPVGVAVLVLLAGWPLAQRLRHEDQRPIAAFLIFTSMLILVAAVVWWGGLLVASAILPPEVMEGDAVGAIILLVSVAAGFVAGSLLVKRPPSRRMPR